jgi:zinc protease
MQQALAAVAAGTIDEQRLADIRDHLRFGMLMELEAPDDIAEALAMAVGISGSADALEQRQQQLAAVTAKELVAFARAHLVAKNQISLRFLVRP